MKVEIEKVYDIDGQIMPIRIAGKTYLIYPMEMETFVWEIGLTYEEFVKRIEKSPFELQKKIIKTVIPEVPDEVLEKAVKSEILLWGKMCLKKIKKDIRTDVIKAECQDTIH
ncbi:hypothetical protein [uncultured Ilyobacter sp.]|uniref:hypothetical protein n=1 Tax=uncultured Ilyobacter sp. TaxID=544433 RepID=UPI002AA722B3|nr:hypothetical protein [uncultured Ilyobacter sp.]